jgi:uncharacterized phiE125 gp8 family phage protein
MEGHAKAPLMMPLPYLHPPVSTPVAPPLLTIATSSAGSPSIITTTTPHYFYVGDKVRITGHSTAQMNGDHTVTAVQGNVNFSIEVGGGAGTGGTVQALKFAEPLTLEEGKLRAGLDWVAGDPRDALMENFIAAARRQVEFDTDLAIRLQMRDVYVDTLDYGLGSPGPQWPGQSLPLWAVQSVSWVNTAGVATPVPAGVYEFDLASGRIGLAPGMAWPKSGALRSLSPWVIRIVAGFPNKESIPADLLDAIGLLTAHKATVGRDLAITGTIISTVPMGYEALVGAYRRETLA